MANFTQTTNYSFKKPTVGADTDQWGTHLNETIDGIDSQLKTLADSITSQQLEQLGNVVNVTPVDDQFLRYNGTNWSAETVTIPSTLNDLSNVSGAPTPGDVLTYNGSAWAPASVTSAAVTDGSVTNAKLHPSLQTVIGRILVTDDDDTPTDNQILVYSTTDAEWKYADQAGSTLQTLTDVSTTGLSDGDLMKYDGAAGEFVFIDAAAARTLLNVDVSGTDNSTPVTLNTTSHDYLTLSSQQLTLGPIVLTDDVSGTLPIANGGTSATTAAGARTSLGLGTLATQNTITESQISDLQSYITASSTDTLTNKSGAISQWTNDAGYLTAETNDLTASVTWTNVPDANITQSSVTQHQAALTITESQISDLQNYLTAETNDLGSAVTGTLPIANGGTGQTSASAARIALLPTLGTAGQVLAVNTGASDVEWVNPATGGGSGTVTSVAISGTDGIEIDSGSPITTSGTITLGLNAATLSSHLSLGTAATTASTDYATAAQGALADSAVQPGDNLNTLGSGSELAGKVIRSDGSGGAAWYNLTVDLPTEVASTLQVANGGTGVSSLGSLDAADLGSGAATDGYVLTADGAGGAAWEAASGGGASLPIDLLSSGASIRKSDGTTAVLSESGGTVTLDNTSLGDTVLMPDNSNNVSTAPGIRFEADTDTGIGLASAGNLALVTGGSERMRITANGDLLVNRTSINGKFCVDRSGVDVGNGIHYEVTGGSISSGQVAYRCLANGTGGNTTSFYAFVLRTENANRCYIYGNGNIENINNSYGGISDIKLKENIVDANSQWDDIKALQVRNYNFIEGPTHTQIGLIAQEVELVSPGLVSESPDRDEEGNDLGTVTKSVNYSVLYMKAVKALQEAMERIETLEAKINALETRIQALEV